MATQPNQKRILVAASMNGGAEVVVPVARRLREQGTVVRVLSYGAATATFRAMKLEPDRVIESGEFLMADALPVEFARFCPTGILTGTQVQDKDHQLTLEQACVVAAEFESRGTSRRIPVVAVLDTWANYLERFSYLDTTVSPPLVSGPLGCLPYKIAIMDEFAGEQMRVLGFPAGRLVVTGSPHFEEVASTIAGFSTATRHGILSKRVFAPSFYQDGKLIVFLSDSWKSYPDIGFTEAGVIESFLRIIDLVAQENGTKINIIVRPHPFRGDDTQAAFAAFTPKHVRAVLHNPVTARGSDPENDYPLEALLYSADLVVGTFGNPNITAAVIRTVSGRVGPSIIQWVPGLAQKYREPPHDFQRFLYESGVTTLATTEAHLEATLKSVLNGSLVQRQFAAAGPGAADKIIALLQ